MIIRFMTKEDADSVASIEKELFSQPWSAQGFVDALDREENLLLVAEEDEQILGYVVMYTSLDEGEITNVATTPFARRRGVGKAILRQLFALSKERGVARIVLEVRVSNDPARKLYEIMGFSELGIRKGFYELPKEDAVIMERVID